MNIVLLQAAGGGGFMGTLPMILLVFVVMYFFMIRPQAKRQKEERKFREEISKGMRVVTSGIHGKLLEVGDTYIILESENSRLKLDKSAISKELSAQYLPKSDPKEKDKDKEKDKK